ncbi:MAG: glycyl-radical enzyme activating protein [Lachnospiraceae bacterium]|nr:glycyl-radical enzyme activating protein [Lachnospiraceae bacterium]
MLTVTNIQKYSIHDGPGIRTTVFFKGCPLRCTWCHNPETQAFEPEIMANLEKCTHCGKCMQVCPQKAVTVMADENVLDREKCTACGMCVDRCPAGARSLAGEEMPVQKIVRAAMKDELFYDESGGGVTLSGGEVLAQPGEDLLPLMRKLHGECVNLAIDTCGAVRWEKIEAAARFADIWLYDLKVMDPATHKTYIGMDNRLILDNLVKLRKLAPRARIFIRIPTVRGISGTDENMRETAHFLKENAIDPEEIDLLPYHRTGSGKYGRLGRTYEGGDLEAPSDEEMKHFQEIFREAGFTKVNIGG